MNVSRLPLSTSIILLTNHHERFCAQVVGRDHVRPVDGIQSIRRGHGPRDVLQHLKRRHRLPGRAVRGRVRGRGGLHPQAVGQGPQGTADGQRVSEAPVAGQPEEIFGRGGGPGNRRLGGAAAAVVVVGRGGR